MHDFIPFTAQQRDTLIGLSMNRISRNITGDLGPRCPTCSGLGYYSKTRCVDQISGQLVATNGARCTCHGSGIDFAKLEGFDAEELWQQSIKLQAMLRGESITSIHKMPKLLMSRQYWMETIAWATADGSPIASSTTETIIFPNVTIPANYMQDGRGIRLRVVGKYSTLGSGTVSHVYQVRWGGVAGTTITKTGTITLLISLTNCLFDIDVMVQTRSNGSSGTLMGNGRAHVYSGTAPTIGSATGSPAEAPFTNGGQSTPAVATVDLTVDTALSVTLLHGANSSSNTATGLQYTIESMN